MASLAKRLRSIDPGWLVVLLLGTLALWPLLTRASLTTNTDAGDHVFRTYEIISAWRQGIGYPRWAPDFYYGFGYPVFDYYSTLSYYLAAAYGLFFGPVAGVKFVFVLSTFLGLAGVYVLARAEWGAPAAIASTALFAFAPYIVLVEPILRGGLPEELAVALAPWLLWSFTRLSAGGGARHWFVAVFSLAAIVLAHNLMSVVFIGLTGAWLVWRLLLIQRPATRAAWLRLAGLMASAALVAALLSAYMWLPAAVERGQVQFQNAFALVQARRFLGFAMIFSPMTTRDIQQTDIALYQFRLGLPQWILGALGALALLRPSPQRRATLFWLLVTLPCLFVMDPSSAWLWQHLSALSFLQFSYRLMAVTALSLAFLAGALVNALAGLRLPLSRNGWAVLLATLAVVAGLPLLNPAPWPDFGPVDPKTILNQDLFHSRGVGTTQEGEFLPVTVQDQPAPAQPVVDAILAGGREKVDRASLPAGASADETAHDALHNTFQVSAPSAFTLRLFTFYWPGWTAYVDGVRAPLTVSEPQGFIAVPLPAGQHSLTIQLEDTPARRLAWAISALGLLALAGAAVIAFRRRAITASAAPAPLAARPARLLAGVAALGLLARGGLDAAYRWSAAHTIASVPQAQVQRFTRFDDGLALIAYDLPPLSASAGAQVPLRFYWEATRPIPEPISVFVHIYAADGQLWGQGDQPDPSLFFPTTRWPLGTPVLDEISAALKPDAPPGRYTLAVGLWNRATGVRSQVLDANGQPTDDVRLTLSDDFEITP